MRRRIWPVAMFTILVVLVLQPSLTTLLAADPVMINQSDYYVVVLQDGRLDIRYTLTFTEHETRQQITQIGPFTSPHTLLSASGDGPDGPFVVQ